MRRSLSIGVLPMRSRMLSTGFRSGGVKAARIVAVGSWPLTVGNRPRRLSTVNGQLPTKTAGRSPPLGWSMSLKLCPARGAAGRTALVVAFAAVHGLAADGGERNFRRHAAAIASDADHLALARSAVAVAGHLPLVAAVLAPLRFVRETTLCVKSLFVLAENEILTTVDTSESLVVERIHEPL